MKKIEFSKILITLIAICTMVVVVVSFVFMWKMNDLSALSYIITGMFAELASGTGFYYWKARRENEIKLSHGLQETITEPFGEEDTQD